MPARKVSPKKEAYKKGGTAKKTVSNSKKVAAKTYTGGVKAGMKAMKKGR
jgi:hypothetical protein